MNIYLECPTCEYEVEFVLDRETLGMGIEEIIHHSPLANKAFPGVSTNKWDRKEVTQLREQILDLIEKFLQE